MLLLCQRLKYGHYIFGDLAVLGLCAAAYADAARDFSMMEQRILFPNLKFGNNTKRRTKTLACFYKEFACLSSPFKTSWAKSMRLSPVRLCALGMVWKKQLALGARAEPGI